MPTTTTGRTGARDASGQRPSGHGPSERTGRGAAGWMRSIRFSWFTVLMILVVVLFVVIISPGLRVFLDQRQQLADLKAQVADAQAQNATLQAQVARWNDPAYVRAQARERLYYVMPGETSLLVLDDVPPAAPVDTGTDSTQIQTTQVDWLSSLFASGMTAGLTTSTPQQLQQNGQLPADQQPPADPAPSDPPAGQ